jgi:hypothetical protein
VIARPVLPLKVLAAAAALAAAATARAQGVVGQAEPSYASARTTTTDAAGTTTATESSEVVQRYRLTYGRSFLPLLTFSTAGNLEWRLGSSRTEEATTEIDSKQWAGVARLAAGGPTLNGALSYERTQRDTESTTGGLRLRSPMLVHDAYGAFASWRPAELPSLDLRLSRTESHDTARVLSDTTVDEASVATRYAPVRSLDVSYTLRYVTVDDRLHLLRADDLTSTARGAWNGSFVDGRLNTYFSFTAGNDRRSAVASGPGGTVSRLQSPTLGLSLVEVFPATPDRDALKPNPALVDGATTTTAGLDVGYGRALAGDVAPRDLGAQFGAALSEVNTIYVWVDRPLPQEIAAAIIWDVYTSDDNVTWTPLATATPPSGGAPVQFSAFDNRFEIGVQRVQARYVKVVTRPLLPAVTADTRFASILVTEVQFLLVELAPTSRTTSSTTAGTMSGTARYLIHRPLNLAYDLSVFYGYRDSPSGYAVSFTNALSFSRRLTPIVGVSARVDRSDSGSSTTQHVAVNRYAVTLAADPLTTLGGTLTYGGQLSEGPAGNGFSHGVSASARADLYDGIAVGSIASYNAGTNEIGQTFTSATVNANASVTPNRVITATGSYAYSRATSEGGGRPAGASRGSRVEGTVSVSPFPALFAAAGVSRSLSSSGPPSTLANVAVSLAPFPRGDLVLRFTYSETLETSAQLRIRSLGPSARWNMNAWAFVDLSYTVTDTSTPALDTDQRALFGRLVVTFR